VTQDAALSYGLVVLQPDEMERYAAPAENVRDAFHSLASPIGKIFQRPLLYPFGTNLSIRFSLEKGFRKGAKNLPEERFDSHAALAAA
jgi:hypothetical protein